VLSSEKPGDYWFAATQLNSVTKPPSEFQPRRTQQRSWGYFQIRKLSNKLSTTRLRAFCQLPVGTSGTPETRRDAVGHNMMVLAQGVEP